MTVQRFSRIEVVENRGYTGAWVTEADFEAHLERVRQEMQTHVTVSAERAWLAAEAMRWACIAAVQMLRGLTDDELLAPRALAEINEEWVAKARILSVLREVQT